MVKIRRASDCDCKTCPGGESAKGPKGEIVYGGWTCTCPCHLRFPAKRTVKLPDIGTDPCPHCNGTGSVAAGSMELVYTHDTEPMNVVRGFEAPENECVVELLRGIPDEGGQASKAIFERLVRSAFQGGLASARKGRAKK